MAFTKRFFQTKFYVLLFRQFFQQIFPQFFGLRRALKHFDIGAAAANIPLLSVSCVCLRFLSTGIKPRPVQRLNEAERTDTVRRRRRRRRRNADSGSA